MRIVSEAAIHCSEAAMFTAFARINGFIFITINDRQGCRSVVLYVCECVCNLHEVAREGEEQPPR